MRIVSLVPSWTETLVECGLDVVGRTRFCIHPAERVKSLPAVGGTKDVDWEKIASLAPDMILLDREENPKSMSEEADRRGLRWHATHITQTADVPRELALLAEILGSSAAGLRFLPERWARASRVRRPIACWEDLPGVLEWIVPPGPPPREMRIAYVIWKDPWMLAGSGTFIASMLETVGAPGLAPLGDPTSKYPAFEVTDLPESTVLLFSSEPFPFGKKIDSLRASKRPCALVDGESFSWFGLRALRFLEGLS